ncbi:MAG: hypothetical protein ACKVWR_07475 [Acidimicrobiales bacterium]
MSTGIKHLSPLRRRDGVTHDQLVAHWRDPHAVGVKAFMRPDRYAITFFDQREGRAQYDGMASVAFDDLDDALTRTGRNMAPEVANDGFVDLVQTPMTRLQVIEHVIVPGPAGGPATAEEREAAYKMTFLVSANEGEDLADLHRHWLEIHAPNVASSFVAAGGVRYVVNLVDRAAKDQPFAGVAELSYRDRDAFKGHKIADDGFNARTTGIALSGREYIVTPRG